TAQQTDQDAGQGHDQMQIEQAAELPRRQHRERGHNGDAKEQSGRQIDDDYQESPDHSVASPLSAAAPPRSSVGVVSALESPPFKEAEVSVVSGSSASRVSVLVVWAAARPSASVAAEPEVRVSVVWIASAGAEGMRIVAWPSVAVELRSSPAARRRGITSRTS